jgi:thiol-disulfide isomerase/thioredoxin
MKNFSATILLTSLALSAFTTNAAQLGMPAPPLKIDHWVKGSPVDLAAGKGKNIYVVEFWATWCPPCRTSIPHLTKMQKQFKDKGVVFIGVTDEQLGTVKPFVQNLGAQMDYTVAIDNKQAAHAAYLGAFGVRSIPHAFIVDKAGNIAWQGHPMENLDTALTRVINQPASAPQPSPAAAKANAPQPLPASKASPTAAKQSPPPAPVAPEKLVLKGVMGSGPRALAIINGKTFGIGDTVKMQLGTKSVSVRCVEIQPGTVVVTTDGGANETLRLEVK